MSPPLYPLTGNHGLKLRKSRSGDKRKVMMLHVIADVEGDGVQWSVVRIGFLAAEEHVVLADEVTGNGMKTHRQEGSGNEINQRLDAEEIENGSVEGDLHWGAQKK